MGGEGESGDGGGIIVSGDDDGGSDSSTGEMIGVLYNGGW